MAGTLLGFRAREGVCLCVCTPEEVLVCVCVEVGGGVFEETAHRY